MLPGCGGDSDRRSNSRESPPSVKAPIGSSGVTARADSGRRHRYGPSGSWRSPFLTLMAFSTVPSPLYGLYRDRDHFSLFMVTVIYAVYAVGVIGALLLAGHLSDWYGRRRLLLLSVGFAILSVLVFLASKSLGGLLVARLVDGVSVGIVLSSSHRLHDRTQRRWPTFPSQSGPGAAHPQRPSTSAGSGVGTPGRRGPRGVGCAPAHGSLSGVPRCARGRHHRCRGMPETREGPQPRPRYRPQRLSVPPDGKSRFLAAALSTFMAFAAVGLFVGLAGLFLAVTLHHPSLALAGAVIGAMFAGSVAAQITTARWPATRVFEAGMAAMVVGLGGAVAAVWLHQPSLGLFIVGGILIGAGAGAIFKGAVGTVLSISAPDRIAESLVGVFLSAYVGLSLPVVGAGASRSPATSARRPPSLSFAIAVSVGIAASAIKLVGGPPSQAPNTPTAAEKVDHVAEGNPASTDS